MNIVVCIKQVPDTKGGVKFNADGTLDRAAMLAIMNPDDKAGLEAALRIKDQNGAKVTVLTMGLPKADAVLREAMANQLQNSLTVTENGKDAGVLSLTYTGEDREQIRDILNSIARNYQEQNIERKSAEASKSLAFLAQQLPEVA